MQPTNWDANTLETQAASADGGNHEVWLDQRPLTPVTTAAGHVAVDSAPFVPNLATQPRVKTRTDVAQPLAKRTARPTQNAPTPQPTHAPTASGNAQRLTPSGNPWVAVPILVTAASENHLCTLLRMLQDVNRTLPGTQVGAL